MVEYRDVGRGRGLPSSVLQEMLAAHFLLAATKNKQKKKDEDDEDEMKMTTAKYEIRRRKAGGRRRTPTGPGGGRDRKMHAQLLVAAGLPNHRNARPGSDAAPQ
ncbi:hypothetical protein H110_05012 [Trichophyton rubrum MR1448]|nr:hypothetical protein H110_05012 [Trichophyton rubrum MR1448]